MYDNFIFQTYGDVVYYDYMLSGENDDLKVENKAQYNTELVTALEVINMVEIAILVVKSAILRRESRGAHFRSDFPESNDAWKRSIVLNKNKIKFEAR